MIEDELRLAAVDRAYRDHAGDVYRMAFAVLHEPESASDATHEAFAKAFERWEQYDAARPLRPWLQRIVVNVALDTLRHRKVRAILVAPDNDRTVLDPAPGVVQRALVDEGLATLRPEARAALVLRHYYGYDYAEIGAALGTSAGNVGSILSRAHAALRVRLATPLATDEPLHDHARRAAP